MQKKKAEIYIWILACLFNMCTIAMGAAIPEMGEVFGRERLSLIQMSMNFAGIAAATVSFFQSRLQERFSGKLLLLTGLMLFQGAGIGAYLMHDAVAIIFLWTGLMGAGCALYYPLVSSIITEEYSGAERGGLLAAQTSVSNLGGIVMSIAGGVLVAWKWYGCFLVNLLAMPVFLVCIWGTSYRKPMTAVCLEKVSGPIDWRMIGKYFLASFTFSLVYFVATPNISVFVEEHGLGESGLSGIGAAMLMAGGMISGFFYKRIVSRLQDLMVEFGIFLAGIGYALLALSGSSVSALLIGCCMTGASFGFVLPYFLFGISNKADKVTLGTAMGVVGTCSGALASFISPLIFTRMGGIAGLRTAQDRFVAAGICCCVLFAIHWYLRVSGKGDLYEHK